MQHDIIPGTAPPFSVSRGPTASGNPPLCAEALDLIAHHEAGHAAVGHALGLHLSEVWIDQAGAGECSFDHVLIPRWVESSPAAALKWMRVLVAGNLASGMRAREMAQAGEVVPGVLLVSQQIERGRLGGEGSDARKALELGERFALWHGFQTRPHAAFRGETDPAAVLAAVRGAEDLAETLLRQRWAGVTRLAGGLARRGGLWGEEAAALVGVRPW